MRRNILCDKPRVTQWAISWDDDGKGEAMMEGEDEGESAANNGDEEVLDWDQISDDEEDDDNEQLEEEKVDEDMGSDEGTSAK